MAHDAMRHARQQGSLPHSCTLPAGHVCVTQHNVAATATVHSPRLHPAAHTHTHMAAPGGTEVPSSRFAPIQAFTPPRFPAGPLPPPPPSSFSPLSAPLA